MHLRYLLVLDFEATCDHTGTLVPREEMEIIEFPTLLYDMEDDRVQATFHEYVRPAKHAILTEFCTQLTGIEQVSGCTRLRSIYGMILGYVLL